jgi:hypothetical protein
VSPHAEVRRIEVRWRWGPSTGSFSTCYRLQVDVVHDTLRDKAKTRWCTVNHTRLVTGHTFVWTHSYVTHPQKSEQIFPTRSALDEDLGHSEEDFNIYPSISEFGRHTCSVEEMPFAVHVVLFFRLHLLFVLLECVSFGHMKQRRMSPPYI